jgi:hypothetical protein
MKIATMSPAVQRKHEKERKILLACGITSSMLYIAMDLLVSARYEGYNPMSQTVSELSAIGAPTREFWTPLGFIYTLLVAAFGWGVWLSAENNRRLRSMGTLLVIYGILGLGWPFAPMNQREVLAAGGRTFSDILHIAFSVVTVLLMLFIIGLGIKALGMKFRVYSIVTIIVLSILGALTGMEAPKLNANLPTPWLGIAERILIGLFLLWTAIFAIALLQNKNRLGYDQ